MPSIDWIGKGTVVNHDKELPFKLLKKVKSKSVGRSSKNLVIHGDNLEALKALMPYYSGNIKCVFIDPPYNTGSENWVYNDKVNSPKIKNWLGKVVGRESEDLCRHDKWLCMMYPRLKLLWELLSEDGTLFVTIDDDEGHYLKVLLDEIFGRENYVNSIVWQKKFSPQNDAKYLSDNHDYIHIFAKNKNKWNRNLLPRLESANMRYKNPDNDPRGDWTSGDLLVKTYSEKYDYPIKTPSGKTINPPKGRCWRVSKERFKELKDNNSIWFGKNGSNVPRLKRFLSDVQEGTVPLTIWLHQEVGHNQEARQELRNLFGDVKLFETPKPVRLLNRILQIATNKEDIILDSFAGSGTTGHSVMDLNKKEKSNRRFILIEMEDGVANKITAERIRLAIKHHKYKEGFEYCELDKPLFDEKGQIEQSCDFKQLASYIYFTETQTNIDNHKINKNYIGEYGGTEYYLIYKNKDKNILNKSFLKKIKKNRDNNKKIVYADICLVDGDTLEKCNLTFKQIPYEVKVY